MKGRADRPPQLNVVSNPLSESPPAYDPGPKSPVEPTEFEVGLIRLLPGVYSYLPHVFPVNNYVCLYS